MSQPPHYNDLDAALEEAWSLLERGTQDRQASGHIIQIATISADGLPSVRSVVLRHFGRDERRLTFNTDARSEKYSEIRACPLIAVHLYDKREKIQLRMMADAVLHHKDDVASQAWSTMKDMSRQCYLQATQPGAVIEQPHSLEAVRQVDEEQGFENFVIVSTTIKRIEWLYLSAHGHRRALFTWNQGTLAKQWLAV